MATKHAVLVGLGDYYGDKSTGYSPLSFVYKNIDDFVTSLQEKNWLVYTPLIDTAASKANIENFLDEKINSLSADDWLLFYYTGHGDKESQLILNSDMFLVNYSSELRYGAPKPLDQFLFDKDYTKIIEKFRRQCPQGHLITILDCCHAAGLIDDYPASENFHSLIAAAQDSDEAYYSRNSFFFEAFSKCWDASNLFELKIDLEYQLPRIFRLSECEIHISPNFSNHSL